MSRKSRLLVVGAVTTVSLFVAAVVGAIATFEDLAIWGKDGGHHVSTPARARVVDLQMAIQEQVGICGVFSDNVETPVIDATFETGFGGGYVVCLKNSGATTGQPISVKASFNSVSDVDTACTGQEADFDETCGDNGVGEAAPLLTPSYGEVDCMTGLLVPGGGLANFAPLSEPVNELTIISNGALDSTRCFAFNVVHSWSDELLEQAGQSDTVSFTIGFTAEYTTAAQP
jgi:hypothetical protein